MFVAELAALKEVLCVVIFLINGVCVPPASAVLLLSCSREIERVI